jgi:hypothetical protein
MPRISSWSVAFLTEPHPSWIFKAPQGYKHYQHKGITPIFAFGYVNFEMILHLVANGFTDMACPTRHSSIRI